MIARAARAAVFCLIVAAIVGLAFFLAMRSVRAEMCVTITHSAEKVIRAALTKCEWEAAKAEGRRRGCLDKSVPDDTATAIGPVLAKLFLGQIKASVAEGAKKCEERKKERQAKRPEKEKDKPAPVIAKKRKRPTEPMPSVPAPPAKPTEPPAAAQPSPVQPSAPTPAHVVGDSSERISGQPEPPEAPRSEPPDRPMPTGPVKPSERWQDTFMRWWRANW